MEQGRSLPRLTIALRCSRMCGTHEQDCYVACSSNAVLRSTAVVAALELQNLVKRFNASITDADFRLKVGGWGIASGGELLQDAETGKLYGVANDVAFYLGEELSSKANILVSDQVASVVTADVRCAQSYLAATRNSPCAAQVVEYPNFQRSVWEGIHEV